MYNKNKIINSWIGLDVNNNNVLVFETADSYFVQYWDDIHFKIAVDEIPSEMAIMFIQNAETETT